MIIKILEDQNIITHTRFSYTRKEFPDDLDYTDFLEREYLLRLAETPPEKRHLVERCNTLQEYYDIVNRDELNAWRRYYTHKEVIEPWKEEDDEICKDDLLFDKAVDKRVFNKFELADEEEKYSEELLEFIRKNLKPEYADVIIAVHINGYSCKEYAETIGKLPNTVNHTLQRAEKKFTEIFTGKCPF